MSGQIIVLRPEHLAAAQAFNARMRAAGAPVAFVQESIADAGPGAPIRTAQEIVWDGHDVRGGVLRVEFPAWPEPAVNFQSPISEGTADKRFSMVAMLLVRHMQQAGHAFIVGMGGFDQPLPRLLAASGWRVREVPFFFRVHRPARFLRELPLVQKRPALARLARLARVSGLGAAGLQALQWRSFRPLAAGCALEPLAAWPAWVDEVWGEFSRRCSFAVRRDRRTLDWLYPNTDTRLLRFALKVHGADIGWVACAQTDMRDDPHFGNLRVGTILDGIAPERYARALVGLADRALRVRGCDLVVSNQLHGSFVQAFTACGFLSRPSNYLFACTPALAAVIDAQGTNLVHVNRGDGDGRIHLLGAAPAHPAAPPLDTTPAAPPR